jgi:hypothetical protein
MPTKWNEIVKKTFADGRKTNPAYSLKSAMKDAKPIYQSMKKGVVAATDSITDVVSSATTRKKKSRSKSGSKGKKSRGKGKGKGKGRKTRGKK